MNQLWAWEYEGKTEVGTQKPGNSCVFKSAASEAIPILRHTDHITNLRKVKVVDEDCQDESHTFVNDTCKYCGQNTPITEPNNFGAIVEAETVSWANRRKFVKLVGLHDVTWFDEMHRGYFDWSDLINPTIISEGVEG